MPQISTVPPEALPQIPSALQVEHRVIHEALLRATKAPGDIGTAARELAGALHDHFVREEEIALPPLGLLAALARGEFTPEMRAVLPMTEALRAELPRMLDEHQAIPAATRRLASEPAAIWGRRSLFTLAGKPLLVSEIFLPDIPPCP